jgi:metallo-beta-lactamase family protein
MAVKDRLDGGLMATITFMGADATVTGSKHLLSTENYRLLIDCGLYQGLKELRLKNWDPLPVPERSINAIALTHAHIDHTGYLPRIVKSGYTGKIYGTPPTCDLVSIMLPDSGRLQEEEAKFANKKGTSRHSPAMPLYSEQDARAVLPMLSPVPYDESLHLAPGIDITCRPAGHILGSSMIEAMIQDENGKLKVVFSGDLGRLHTPMLTDPSIIREADYLVLESTYGDRLHSPVDRKESLGKVVIEALKRGGILLIPAFAVERTQELIYILNLLKISRDIPDVPIYIDSPMAVSVSRLFSKYRDIFDEEASALLKSGTDILDSAHINYCETVDQSKELNLQNRPMIILSASGMATGGRILHHLRHRLPDPRNTVLLVGYQAIGTRGRSLQEGAKEIRIFGENVPVKAHIASIDGFSSHADYNEILDWLGNFTKAPRKIFLVHGEPAAQQNLSSLISQKLGWVVEIPEYIHTATLDGGQ